MYLYICVNVYTVYIYAISMYTFRYVYSQLYISVYKGRNVYLYIHMFYTHGCKNMFMYTCIYVYIHVDRHACAYMCVCMDINTHIHV